MALDNYTNLKIAVIDQSHRGDIDLKVDDFIQLAETEMKANEDEPLNLRAEEVSVDIPTVVDANTIPLPTDYQHSRGLRILFGDSKVRLTYRTPASMPRRTGSGSPCFYTIMGSNILFDINTDAIYTVTLEYLSDLSPITAANPTNTVLTKYPNVYLFGCLKQAFIYAVDPEQAIQYHNLFLAAISSANTAEAIGRFGDSPEQAVGWAP